MSPKELLVLASKLGAITFYGLKDPFRGMGRAEIKASIPQLQRQAEKRGLAVLGFEEEFTVKPEVAELITTCTKCERYMTVDVVVDGTQQPREAIYFYRDNSVLLQDHTEEVILQKADTTVLRDKIYEQYFSKQIENKGQNEDVRLPPVLLNKLRTVYDGGEEQLKQYGCSEDMAKAIMQGLHGECLYISLVSINIQKSTCISLLCILSVFGIVRLWLENDAGVEHCHATWISRQGVAKELTKLFQGF